MKYKIVKCGCEGCWGSFNNGLVWRVDCIKARIGLVYIGDKKTFYYKADRVAGYPDYKSVEAHDGDNNHRLTLLLEPVREAEELVEGVITPEVNPIDYRSFL